MNDRIFLMFFVTVIGASSFSMTLDEYLSEVRKKNRALNSMTVSQEASEAKRAAGDLALSPVFTAGYSLASDKSLPNSVADRREMTELSLGLAKKFSTGTALSLTAKTDQFENDKPTTPSLAEYSTGTLGLTLQQSLWKDFFGQATRLRNDREWSVQKLESLTIDLKTRGLLLEAESAFWDYAVAQEDLKLKKENLERAKKIESWTTNRVNNGISDRSDLMNARALASIRELELSLAQDELKAQDLRLRQNLDLSDAESTPAIQANLFDARPYMQDLSKQKNVIKIDAYLSSLEAKTKKLVAEEVEDSLKPDLNFIGSYNTNSYNRDYATTQSDISKTDRPKTFVGVNLTWMFDTEAKQSQLAAARKEALALRFLSEKNLKNGQEAWLEQQRKYEVSLQNVKTLEKIAQYQRERAKAEQDKFAKGRTITANVVTAETDSAEAEVKFLKAKSGLRKLEASALMFMPIENNEKY